MTYEEALETAHTYLKRAKEVRNNLMTVEAEQYVDRYINFLETVIEILERE